ncbi:3-oxoacyl-reductase [Cucurbitaria berberidis CBS 394.84]|uniref:3-oxoacyl-reductase n=1 Tax=Cucurbitaria berberidis CBS 394.84 TaxID=1168544 RepID=A0A9P4G8L8_9PLEO|nr:3-oxoacyl-reductase [Cucurbitaria berberidis CBS 394.84]KAF1841113.1 3-oxoacyl-reductase [Cucurbitaria berberidis CBS 394.84]
MVGRPRHVLITGGSRGIGLAIAQMFAKNAYRCTLISRSEEDLKAAVQTLQPLSSNSSEDITSTTSLSASEPRSKQENLERFSHGYIAGNISHASNFWTTNSSKPSHFGTYLPKARIRQEDQVSRIDVLVNCAGTSQAKLFTAMEDARIDSIINTNLTSMMIGTRFLLRQGYLSNIRRSSKAKDELEEGSNVIKVEEETSPVIINVASLLGLQGGYGAVAYAASKAGVLGFTRALATEYASHRVRVNAIVPGYVDTEMTKDLNHSELKQRIPLGRFGKPEEIAQAALFLAENQYAHDCVMNIDGGLSAV